MANRWGNSGDSGWVYLGGGGSKITADGDRNHEIKRHLLHGRKAMTNLDSILKSRDITLPTKVHLVKAMIFPVVMYRCERWTIKKSERQRIMPSNCDAEEDSWESLDCKEINPVNPKGNQLWIFTRRTDESWPPNVKNWLDGKDHCARKDSRQKEKGMTEAKMVRWRHWLNGHEFEQTPESSEG